MLQTEDESQSIPVRGRARSQSFRGEEEELVQRGIGIIESEDKINKDVVSYEISEDNQQIDTEKQEYKSPSILRNSSGQVSTNENIESGQNKNGKRLLEANRRESDDRLVNKTQNAYVQMRDVGSLSQKTINTLKNLQDPRINQRQKTEAELAEEELERTSLAKGFLTPTQYDYYVKILLLGDSGVGKTSLMLRFADDQFRENLIGTAGVDFKVKYLDKNGIKTKCQLWDTAGQEKFHVITKSYYRGAHGIALVYDVCDKNSFDKLGYWMENIKTEASEDVFLILIANKIDKPDRVVSSEEGKSVADKHGYKYFETSAKSGLNVVKAFESLSILIVSELQKKEERHKAKGDSLTPLRAQQRNIIKGRKKCCVIC